LRRVVAAIKQLRGLSDEIITRFRNRVPEGLWGGDPQNGRRAVGFATARRAVPHAPNEVATAIDRRPTIMGGVWPRRCERSTMDGR